MNDAHPARALPLALALALALPQSARAQDPTGVSRATDELRSATATATADCDPGPLVVRVTSQLPAGAPDAWGLISTLLSPTLAALSDDARFDPVHLASFGRDGTHPAALAHRLGYARMVDVTVRVERATLVLEGSVWTTAPESRHAVFTRRVPLDVTLRQHVGFPAILTDDAVRARSVRIPGRGYVALAIHDLDGDGRVEIVAARVGEAHVFRIDGRRARLVGRAAYPADVPRATSPRRRLVGSAIAVGRSVVVRLSNLAAPIAITLEGGVPTARRAEGPCSNDRYPMVGGCAALVDGRDFFDEVLTRRDAPYPEAAAHFYAYAYRRFLTRAAEPVAYEALITPNGRLAVRVRQSHASDGDAPRITEHTVGAVGYGTALAMTDLDMDGSAEILVSHASPEGGGDQLSLIRALPHGGLRVMWRGEVVGGSIWVAAEGDVDDDGQLELVAIEEPASGRGRARLWIVR